ncbi:MAG: hypothetical protein CL897_04625 [Dehalococcoidia bacterium]|nr:hypothetical protein [Dehalococcoidia bacterium]
MPPLKPVTIGERAESEEAAMRGRFERLGGLCTEESADGHVITYMRVAYEGEGPFHESTRPIALGLDDGSPQPLGPSHEQVAERLVRQANYGVQLLAESDVPKYAREFFFAAINRPLIPREFAVPLRVQDTLEALLALEDIVGHGPSPLRPPSDP